MNKLNKLILPIVILGASIILGGFFYASQVNKQQSIERQQEIKLQDDRRAEEAKAGQVKKEYIAKRKGECYSLYEKEWNKWNNVKSNEYDEEKDVCLIRYATDFWKGKNCDDYFPNYLDCINNTYTEEF